MSFLKQEDIGNVPTIPEYFKNKTIFITGGSGFMGLALVEKLLYSCQELDKIYLLMRQKKGVSPGERLEKLYSSSCFDRLRNEKPKIFYEKVHIIAGDILDLGLGLSDNDRDLLIDKVNIVFHVAASVRFNDPLSYAVKINIRGLRELIVLAKGMKNLSSFIHVSTAYCNCQHDVIDEVLYPPVANWREVLEVCENMDEETIRILTPKYLNGMPNTYVFTKQLAEHLVNEERSTLPVAIIRPSIVIASREEPAPGWVNNFNGPNALYIAVGKGIKYSLYADANNFINYIPLDVCIRSFIVTAWALGTNRLRHTEKLPIFNCSTEQKDVLTYGVIARRSFDLAKKLPMEEIVWVPKMPVMTNNFIRHYFISIFWCVLPAILVDRMFVILGKKPRLLAIQRKVYEADIALNYFVSKNWEFVNKNFLEIRQLLHKEDMKKFYYETDQLFADDSYLETCLIGGMQYLLNLDMSPKNIYRAKRKHFRMKVLDQVCRIIFYGCFLWIIINTKFFQNVYQNWLPLK